MSRECRHDGCTNPAAPHVLQCNSCRHKAYRARHPRESAWAAADPTDVALIVEVPRPVEGLTRLERVLVARGLTKRDMTAQQIAAVCGVTPRTVYRWRTRPPASARIAA